MVVGFGIWLAVSSDCTCWWIHEKTQVRPYLRTASCHRPGLKFEHVELSWFSMIFYDFLEMMRWYMNLIPVPLASEGGETPELFESEFWVAAVSVSRNGILIQCLIAMLFSLVELFGSCNLQGEQHPLVLVCFDGFRLVWWFQNIWWIEKTCMRKEPSTPYRQDICMFFFGAIEARWWWLILRLLSLSLVSWEHCHQMFTDHNVSSLSSSFCAIPP